jgi:uncharacterized phage-like protein YoqJ
MISGYVCSFTGHRDIPPDERERLFFVLDHVISKLIDKGVTVFRTGGAIGFDTLAALKVLEKKKLHPEVKLHLFLPCKDQSARWNGYNVEAYDFIMANADEITYTAEEYTRGCMLHRDRCMINGADFCVAFCQKEEGGTAYTLNYAKKHGVRAINIATMM